MLLDLRERLRRADPAIVDTFAPGLTQEEIGDAVGLTAAEEGGDHPVLRRNRPEMDTAEGARHLLEPPAEPRGARLDHRQRLGRLGGDDAGHAAFQDAGLFAGDLGQRLAQILGVVDRDGGDDRQPRGADHVGRVQPPAQPQQDPWSGGQQQTAWGEPAQGGPAPF